MLLSSNLLVSAPTKFTVTGALRDQLLFQRNMFLQFHLIESVSVWNLHTLQMPCMGWHITHGRLHGARSRSQLLFPGWYFPEDMVEQTQPHCPVPLPTKGPGELAGIQMQARCAHTAFRPVPSPPFPVSSQLQETALSLLPALTEPC